MSREREPLVTSDAFASAAVVSFIKEGNREAKGSLMSMLRLFSEGGNSSLYIARKGGFGSDTAEIAVNIGVNFLNGLRRRGVINHGLIFGYEDDRFNTENMLMSDEKDSPKRAAVAYIAPMMSELFKRKALKGAEGSLEPSIGDEGFEVIMNSIECNQAIIDSAVADIVNNSERFYQGPNFPLLVLLAHGAIGFHLSKTTIGGTSMEKWLAIDFPITISEGNFIKSIIIPTNGPLEGYVEEIRALSDPLKYFIPLAGVPREGFEPSRV